MARRKNKIEEGKNEDGNSSKGKNEDGSTSSSPPEYSSAETEGGHQDSDTEDSKAEEDPEEPISTRLCGKSGGAEMSSPEDEQSSEAQEAKKNKLFQWPIILIGILPSSQMSLKNMSQLSSNLLSCTKNLLYLLMTSRMKV